ncbi:MAG: trypsin-like peptidase domain-containing protein [Caulobacterales bacterium]|nr:trypsin-like peptidase domain-containing protein [Caulobacterales bacterium]
MTRVPDWLIYGGVIAAALAASVTFRSADAPPAPPVAGEDELGGLLGPATPFDPTVVVQTPDTPAQSSSGTAFSVSGQGLWLTARHVVEACREAALIVGGGRAVSAQIQLSTHSDLAVLTTDGGPDALPLATAADRLRIGFPAFHPGFPQGRPGEVASRLIGRETLHIRGRGQHDEPVLAWAEIGRTEGLHGTLSGLSGGPALDSHGRIVAVTIAEAPRRGRIYTTAIESLAPITDTLDLAGEYTPGTALNVRNYGTASDALRRDLRVAQVVCLRR